MLGCLFLVLRAGLFFITFFVTQGCADKNPSRRTKNRHSSYATCALLWILYSYSFYPYQHQLNVRSHTKCIVASTIFSNFDYFHKIILFNGIIMKFLYILQNFSLLFIFYRLKIMEVDERCNDIQNEVTKARQCGALFKRVILYANILLKYLFIILYFHRLNLIKIL